MTPVHPIVWWQLPQGLVVGMVAGTPLSLAGTDLRAVTSGLAAELLRHDVQPVLEARLVRRVVPIRPTWAYGAVRHVAAAPLPVPVDVVIARTASGWLAHVPRLGRSVGSAVADGIEALVDEEVAAWGRYTTPGAVHAELRAPIARFTTVSARRPPKVDARADQRMPEVLLRVAEREPPERRRRAVPGAWLRNSELDEVTSHLRAGRHVVVLGDPGVGKSTVLRDAIATVVSELPSRTFWRTTTHRIVAGARYLGEWQERADAVAEALTECDGTLWVEDLRELFVWGGAPEASIAAYWRAAIVERRFSIVGEASAKAWDTLRSALPVVADAFATVSVAEMSIDASREVIDRYAELLLAQREVELRPEAKRRSLRLLDRFVRYERFPGKAARFLASLADRAAREGRREVGDADVVTAFEHLTGLPRRFVDDTLPLPPAEVEAALAARIVAQPAAVAAVTRALVCWKAGLNDPDRPVATLLFAGPTGVGKTALAKAVADLCFGAGGRRTPLVRVDMSELGAPWQVDRLLGTGADAGPLVRELRERPFSVLLLDEIEKAHPLFFDLLLSVLDEGRLGDALGRTTDLRGAILVMTTNLGSHGSAGLGFGGGAGEGRQPAVDVGAIRSYFRPEFYNRLDEVVPFAPLDRDAVRAIARIELEAVARRPGVDRRALELVFTDAVVDRVAVAGFDPMFGARPLQRVIEQQVVAALARALVDEQHIATRLTIDVAPDGDGFTVRAG